MSERQPVLIRLIGCDDTTRFDLEVTPEEYMFLARLEAASERASTCACMPTLKVALRESAQ